MTTNNQINVRDYGAVGDNTTNDTAAIQAAINACPLYGTVVIFEDMNCAVNTLEMRSNVNFHCYGTLNQVTANNLEVFDAQNKQNSSYPLIQCSLITNVTITVRSGATNYEGVLILQSSFIKIIDSKFDGRHSPGGFAGIMIYSNNHITISNCEIFSFGIQRTTVPGLKTGTGIRLLNTDYLFVENNRVHDNAENGIITYMCRFVKIDRNEIYNNGLSGIQVAFGDTGIEYDYLISYNWIKDNMADSIDMNNASCSGIVNLKALLIGNHCEHNGFVGSSPTADGSGIATLISITNVVAKNNRTTGCNKGAFYISNCGVIVIEENFWDKQIDILSTFDRIEINKNVMGGHVNLIATADGNFLGIRGNSATLVSLPNGVKIKELVITENYFSQCNINFTLTGSVVFSRNRTVNSNATASRTLYVGSVTNGLLISENIIEQTSDADCITIATPVQNVRIINNKITSINVLIYDSGAPYLQVEGNFLTANSGGSTPARTYSGNPSNALLCNNTHNSPSNTLKLFGGTIWLSHENFASGFLDAGPATVKNDLYS